MTIGIKNQHCSSPLRQTFAHFPPAVGGGEYSSICDARSVTVKTTRIIEPNREQHEAFKPLLEMYRATYTNLKTTLHTQTTIARGSG